MVSFLDAVVAFPTALFTTLLGVVLFYWLLALLGVVDLESLDLEPGPVAEADAYEVSTVAGYVVAFGLNGVPFSIAISLVILVSWTLSCLGAMWLLPLVPGEWANYGAGAVLALASLSLAVTVSARMIRPLRGLFVTHAAIHNASLVGQTCKVLTQTVDEQVGRAEVAQHGVSLNIRIWTPVPNALARGSNARIVAYDEKTARYKVAAEP